MQANLIFSPLSVVQVSPSWQRIIFTFSSASPVERDLVPSKIAAIKAMIKRGYLLSILLP
jgi:hypothetical protein